MNGASLWELQQLDTALDQLHRRLTKLPEAVALAEAEARLADHRAAIAAAGTQLADAEETIERIEHESETSTTSGRGSKQQLKIVTETRQADALKHEIETLNTHRDELDDRELEAMDQQAQAEARLAELAADEDAVVAMRESAAAALVAANGAGAADEAELAVRRDAARAALSSDETTLYDHQRARHDGVGIAKLDGLRCNGCHIDLSPGRGRHLEGRAGRRAGRVPAVRPHPGSLTNDVPVVPRHRGAVGVVRVPRPTLRLSPAAGRFAAARPHRRARRSGAVGAQPDRCRGHAGGGDDADGRAQTDPPVAARRCRSACCCTSCGTVRSPRPGCSGGRSAVRGATTRCRRWSVGG